MFLAMRSEVNTTAKSLQQDLCLAKTSYTHKMNDLAQSSIRAFPIKFLP
jgi:hypothetical protein